MTYSQKKFDLIIPLPTPRTDRAFSAPSSPLRQQKGRLSVNRMQKGSTNARVKQAPPPPKPDQSAIDVHRDVHRDEKPDKAGQSPVTRHPGEDSSEASEITNLAARSLDAPMAMILCEESGSIGFRSAIGMNEELQDSIAAAFTPLLHEQSVTPVVIADAENDGRTSGFSFVTNAPNVKFLAFQVIRGSDGQTGLLCVLDTRKRTDPDREGVEALQSCARLAGALFKRIQADAVAARQAERDAKAKRRLLLELNHRVKNTLAILQSLSLQTARNSPDGDAYHHVFSRRVQSISMTHELLSLHEWNGVALPEVIEGQISIGSQTGLSPETDVPDVMLTPDQALGIGLILHELLNLAEEADQTGGTSIPCSLSGKIIDGQKNDLEEVLHLRWSGGPLKAKGHAEVTPFGQDAFTHRVRIAMRGLDKVLGSNVRIYSGARSMEADITLPL